MFPKQLFSKKLENIFNILNRWKFGIKHNRYSIINLMVNKIITSSKDYDCVIFVYVKMS